VNHELRLIDFDRAKALKVEQLIAVACSVNNINVDRLKQLLSDDNYSCLVTKLIKSANALNQKVKLDEIDKNRVFFHLGMLSRSGVDPFSINNTEKACNTIENEYHKKLVLTQLTRCDAAYDKKSAVGDIAPISTLSKDIQFYSLRERVAGDINRTSIREMSSDKALWEGHYLDETDELAILLSVKNYRRVLQAGYRKVRSEGGTVNLLPGVADTSVGSRIVENQQLAGGFGGF